MLKKSTAALVAAGALCTLAPSLSIAGGEVQETERITRTTSYQSAGQTAAQAAPSQYGNGAPPPAYARPMGSYYQQPMSPCGTMPYGGGQMSGGGQMYGGGCCPSGGGGGGLFGGNQVFTAGLLGLGLGYLIWH